MIPPDCFIQPITPLAARGYVETLDYQGTISNERQNSKPTILVHHAEGMILPQVKPLRLTLYHGLLLYAHSSGVMLLSHEVVEDKSVKSGVYHTPTLGMVPAG